MNFESVITRIDFPGRIKRTCAKFKQTNLYQKKFNIKLNTVRKERRAILGLTALLDFDSIDYVTILSDRALLLREYQKDLNDLVTIASRTLVRQDYIRLTNTVQEMRQEIINLRNTLQHNGGLEL